MYIARAMTLLLTEYGGKLSEIEYVRVHQLVYVPVKPQESKIGSLVKRLQKC